MLVWHQPIIIAYIYFLAREDVITAKDVPEAAVAALYTQLASGAETGWDFSSRWLANSTLLASIRTSNILPVDLNIILLRAERHLSQLFATGKSLNSYDLSNPSPLLILFAPHPHTYHTRD